MFAEIIFPIRSFRTFTYRIPKQLIYKISTGSSVYAKINNKLASGYVVEISKKCAYKGKINSIDSIHEALSIPLELIKLIEWVSKYYLCPMGIIYNSVLPKKIISINEYQYNFI